MEDAVLGSALFVAAFVLQKDYDRGFGTAIGEPARVPLAGGSTMQSTGYAAMKSAARAVGESLPRHARTSIAVVDAWVA